MEVLAILVMIYAIVASIATGDMVALGICILGGIGIIWAILKS